MPNLEWSCKIDETTHTPTNYYFFDRGPPFSHAFCGFATLLIPRYLFLPLKFEPLSWHFGSPTTHGPRGGHQELSVLGTLWRFAGPANKQASQLLPNLIEIFNFPPPSSCRCHVLLSALNSLSYFCPPPCLWAEWVEVRAW